MGKGTVGACGPDDKLKGALQAELSARVAQMEIDGVYVDTERVRNVASLLT